MLFRSKSSSLGDSASEDDIGNGERGLGEVAAGERQLMGLGEGEKTVEKPVNKGGGKGRRRAAARCASRRCASGLTPFYSLDEIFRKGQGQERGDGTSAHGGQIAESAGESPMTDGFGWMPVEAEMAAGDGEVGGDGQLLAGGGMKESAVVADAELQLWTLGVGCAKPNSAEQGQLTETTETSAART